MILWNFHFVCISGFRYNAIWAVFKLLYDNIYCNLRSWLKFFTSISLFQHPIKPERRCKAQTQNLYNINIIDKLYWNYSSEVRPTYDKNQEKCTMLYYQHINICEMLCQQ